MVKALQSLLLFHEFLWMDLKNGQKKGEERVFKEGFEEIIRVLVQKFWFIRGMNYCEINRLS